MTDQQTRILLVDSDGAARRAAASVLAGAGLEVVAEASSGEEALQRARISLPTVAIIDIALPGMGAAVTIRRLRDSLPHRIETVAIANFSDAASMGELVDTGTAAYVVKGKPGDLVGAVKAVVSGSGLLSAEASRPVLDQIQRRYEEALDQNTELEQTVAQLQTLSVTDWLTGLKNHGYFFERLSEELERSRRYDRPLAVIVADIDDFKRVNDAFGHSTGDSVLRFLGEAFRAAVREVDVACRIGGEEFGFILPETDADGALQAAERIREDIESVRVPPVGKVTVSLGVAVYPFHSVDPQGLVEAADRALYEAKSSGKNRSHVVGDRHLPGLPGKRLSAMGPVVGTLLSALKLRSPSLVERSLRVADLATSLGLKLKLMVAEVERLRVASLLHDVGMMAVPDAVLQKAGSLTEEEWELVRKHPEDGHGLIVASVHPDVAAAVLSHHERFDGSGYPYGLEGEDIPRFGRMILAVDAFDAMSMDRPDRPAKSIPEIFRELRRGAGTQFDPEIVEALEEAVSDSDGKVVPFPVSNAG